MKSHAWPPLAIENLLGAAQHESRDLRYRGVVCSICVKFSGHRKMFGLSLCLSRGCTLAPSFPRIVGQVESFDRIYVVTETNNTNAVNESTGNDTVPWQRGASGLMATSSVLLATKLSRPGCCRVRDSCLLNADPM